MIQSARRAPRRKASSPSDEHTRVERARREVATLRLVWHEDRAQRPWVTSGSAHGDRSPATEYVNTDVDGSDVEKVGSSEFLPTEMAFY